MHTDPSDTRDVASLAALVAAGAPVQFLHFWGHSPGRAPVGPWVLSQWFPAPFTVDGDLYPTAEHWMMAEKARLFGDEARRAQILASARPAEVKAHGRAVAGFDEPRWQANRYEIVVQGSLHKFSQNPDFGAWLQGTQGRVLVEASPVDRIWGIGLPQDDPRAQDPAQWRGLNLLGFALMEARARLAG